MLNRNKDMKTLQLTKQSSENEIKDYFKAVLKLAKSQKEYPINFDEVWMLVYEDRRSAIYELKDKFIQDVDFQMVRKKVQASNVAGFVWADDYYLTVPCMEFFIARKVRPVFEVYRKVFHKAAENISLNLTPTRVKTSLEWVKGVREILNLNDSSTLFMLKQVGDPLGLPTPDYTLSKGQLLAPTILLQQHGVQISTREFNQKMMDAGYLKELQRPSSNGKIKYFKSLTERAAGFGENQINPSNPKETQPLYYTDKFENLLRKLQITI